MPSADGDNLETPEAAAIVDELLTPREAEVLAMMVRGASNVVIAERLAIKEGTVKSHVKHILRKLDAVNRAEAISRYMGRPQG
jgi:DNA-binding NarL/FixJ family response regulator